MMRPRLGKMVGEHCEEEDMDLKGQVREALGVLVAKLQYGEEGNEEIIEGRDGRGVGGGGAYEGEGGQVKCGGGVGVGG